MKRIELFEFADASWLPTSVRAGVTSLNSVLYRLNGTIGTLTDLLQLFYHKYPFEQVVDLDSGSGGALPEVIDELNRGNVPGKFRLLLTDSYPDATTVANVNNLNRGNLRYFPLPLEAKQISEAPSGLKTMIASFHHLSPGAASEVLTAATKGRQPLLIYELAANNIPLALWILLLPLSLTILFLIAWANTPFIRPLTARQLLLTYLIPVIPLVYAWDVQASLMRTYTFEDFKTLLGQQSTINYAWEMNEARKPSGKVAGYYVFGYPRIN